ncbi:hypothetical protein ACOME3_005605 [Neoechinorhynchus agilis]
MKVVVSPNQQQQQQIPGKPISFQVALVEEENVQPKRPRPKKRNKTLFKKLIVYTNPTLFAASKVAKRMKGKSTDKKDAESTSILYFGTVIPIYSEDQQLLISY